MTDVNLYQTAEALSEAVLTVPAIFETLASAYLEAVLGLFTTNTTASIDIASVALAAVSFGQQPQIVQVRLHGTFTVSIVHESSQSTSRLQQFIKLVGRQILHKHFSSMHNLAASCPHITGLQTYATLAADTHCMSMHLSIIPLLSYDSYTAHKAAKAYSACLQTIFAQAFTNGLANQAALATGTAENLSKGSCNGGTFLAAQYALAVGSVMTANSTAAGQALAAANNANLAGRSVAAATGIPMASAGCSLSALQTLASKPELCPDQPFPAGTAAAVSVCCCCGCNKYMHDCSQRSPCTAKLAAVCLLSSLGNLPNPSVRHMFTPMNK